MPALPPVGLLGFTAIILYQLICVGAFQRVDLNGDGWSVSQNPTKGTVPGKVPGSVYTALMENGTIGDPLYRDNDDKYAWIGLADWTYSRNFVASSSVASSKSVVLVAEGLDTIATVMVNGKTVGHSDNMFVRYVFNITGVVKAGNNTIVIHFSSPVKWALAKAQNSSYTIPPNCPASAQNGQCHINQIRKEQCSFSWDWGPSFPTQGIWKPIYIDAFNNAVIREVSALARKVNSTWEVDIEGWVDIEGGGDVKGQVHATIGSLKASITQNVTLLQAKNQFKIKLQIPATTIVPLWWPNGHGKQPLFDLDVSFVSGGDASSKTLRIGFRTIELVQDKVSNNVQHGLSFYFRVNGIPIFLKGSNWIPADSFQERITKASLRFLLESAKNVSINSLRVWGGGVYESEDFYQLCDELGIMIWQDFMFSVATYPTYPAFLASVHTEVTQQLRRLKSHPSIIVWAGNNENEGGLRGHWFGSGSNYTLYYNDYVKLYVTTIKPIVDSEDSTRTYLLSSPSNGIETEKEGYIANDPQSQLYGDIHFYDYSVDQWKASSFRIPRMASEYGVQAWCNKESLAKVFAASDYSMTSAIVNHRQHHGNGNTEMANEVKIHLNLPNSSNAATNFEDFIYLTQVNQAMCIRTQTEHYRRYQNRLLPDGRGLTMGALYWQINDIWQAPTWASIDYEGAWKMLHYYAKSFFSDTLISPYEWNDGTLDVFLLLDNVPLTESRNVTDGTLSFKLAKDTDLVSRGLSASEVSEKLKAVGGRKSGELRVDIYDYSSFKALHAWTQSYSVQTAAESIFTKKISELLSTSGCPSKESCVLHFTAKDLTGAQVSTSWFALAYPKASKLKSAHVKVNSVTKIDQFTFEVEVTSDAIALFVWLSTDTIKGQFSDNGFLQLTPSTKVLFHAHGVVTADALKSQLHVRSVADVKSDAPIIG